MKIRRPRPVKSAPPQSGWMVSQDPHQTERVTRWVVQASRGTPVYVKLSPTVTDIAGIGRAVEKGGAQAVCAIDTLEGILGVDRDTLSPLPSVQGQGTRGGYSGRAVKPVALRCVADLAGAVSIPISGVGGVYDWRDALDFILLGASTVQVCTAVMQQRLRRHRQPDGRAVALAGRERPLQPARSGRAGAATA